MLLEGAFLIFFILKFYEKVKIIFVTKFIFLFYRHSAVNRGNGCVKNKMLNNGSILKICCKNIYNKATYQKSRWLDKKLLLKKCLNNILVMKKEKVGNALKSYEAFFWPFYSRVLWPQKWSFWQKNYFTQFVFTLFKNS